MFEQHDVEHRDTKVPTLEVSKLNKAAWQACLSVVRHSLLPTGTVDTKRQTWRCGIYIKTIQNCYKDFYYIHTYHSRFIPEGVAEVSQIFLQDDQNYLAMSNTADVTGGKPIAVWSQSISGVSAIIPLVTFYDIHGRKREVLFFYYVPTTTRDILLHKNFDFVLRYHCPKLNYLFFILSRSNFSLILCFWLYLSFIIYFFELLFTPITTLYILYSYFPLHPRVVWKRSLCSDKTAHCTFIVVIFVNCILFL
jgi:hypothetical protein